MNNYGKTHPKCSGKIPGSLNSDFSRQIKPHFKGFASTNYPTLELDILITEHEWLH